MCHMILWWLCDWKNAQESKSFPNMYMYVYVQIKTSLSMKVFHCTCNLLITWLSGKRRYNFKIWKTFTDCFNCLPVAAIVDDKIFCCHGGVYACMQVPVRNIKTQDLQATRMELFLCFVNIHE